MFVYVARGFRFARYQKISFQTREKGNALRSRRRSTDGHVRSDLLRRTTIYSMPLDRYTYVHFFSPLACTISHSQLVRNVSRSSSVLASFAQICLLSSTWRFFADADADDDGFPVRCFLRVRTFQLLPRPSADLRHFTHPVILTSTNIRSTLSKYV